MKLPVLLAAAFLVISTSCTYIGGDRVRGNGNVKTEDRRVANFTSVSSHGAYDVYLSQGSAYSVRVEAEENLIPYIETFVNGDELEIRTKDGYWLKSTRDLKVYITAPAFARVKTLGSGNILSQGLLNNTSAIDLQLAGSGDIKVQVNAPDVKAEIRGSGNIDVAGQTRSFTGEIQGSGDIKASELKAETVNVDIKGSGDANVFASVQLNVEVRGSGDVKYRGGANVSSDIAGSGSVKKVD